MSWFRFIVEEGRWPAISPPKPEHTGVLIRWHRTRFQLPAYANGTGHVNIGQGEVMTVRGVGTSLSPAIGGWIAQRLGYPATFLILGSFTTGSILIWLWFLSLLKPACAARSDEGGGPTAVLAP